MKWIAPLAVALVVGCHHVGYEKDRTFQAVHIFGIGWINNTTETNHMRVFGVGLIDAARYSTDIETNAPYAFTKSTGHPVSGVTNAPARTNVVVIRIE